MLLKVLHEMREEKNMLRELLNQELSQILIPFESSLQLASPPILQE
jgi:hypothetical protein